MFTAYLIGCLLMLAFILVLVRSFSRWQVPHYPRIFAGILLWPLVVPMLVIFMAIELARMR